MFIFLKFEIIFRTAIPEPFRSHFAKIGHKVAESKYFSNAVKSYIYEPANLRT